MWRTATSSTPALPVADHFREYGAIQIDEESALVFASDGAGTCSHGGLRRVWRSTTASWFDQFDLAAASLQEFFEGLGRSAAGSDGWSKGEPTRSRVRIRILRSRISPVPGPLPWSASDSTRPSSTVHRCAILLDAFAVGARGEVGPSSSFWATGSPERPGVRWVEVRPASGRYEVFLHTAQDVGHPGLHGPCRVPTADLDDGEEFGRRTHHCGRPADRPEQDSVRSFLISVFCVSCWAVAVGRWCRCRSSTSRCPGLHRGSGRG